MREEEAEDENEEEEGEREREGRTWILSHELPALQSPSSSLCDSRPHYSPLFLVSC